MKMAVFVDGNGKMSTLSIKRGVFMDGSRGYLLYLHDLGVILSASEGSVNGKYKLILYKMAEFKDGTPILIHLSDVSSYRFCK